MASITGFGSTGPYAQYKVSDIVSMAMGGLTYVNGPPDAAPVTAPCEQAKVVFEDASPEFSMPKFKPI